MSASTFYRAFEDRHRGSRELIQSRLEVYLPFIRAVTTLLPGAQVTDLGCGRGEWLELLQQSGIAAQGVDLDEGMLAACRERGLDVTHGDAIAYLKNLPDASQAVVSAFHVAEHLPFDLLEELVAHAFRALRPGGLLILETPNPENLAVGTSGFYMDPTHQRPLPPALLAFLPEFLGFARVKTLRLQEGASLRGRTPVRLEDVLAGVSPDYAVIAQKAPDAPPAGEAQDTLDASFARVYGLTLHELAERHERQWETRLQQAQAVAEAARRTALAIEKSTGKTLEEVAALRHKVLVELVGVQGQLKAVHESRSWRITRPVRWATDQLIAVRKYGVRQRARSLVRAVGRLGLSTASRTFARFPWTRRAAVSALRVLGLRSFAERLRDRLKQGGPVPRAAVLTPAAQRVESALRRKIQARPAAVSPERKD